jgi:hypothetical protein
MLVGSYGFVRGGRGLVGRMSFFERPVSFKEEISVSLRELERVRRMGGWGDEPEIGEHLWCRKLPQLFGPEMGFAIGLGLFVLGGMLLLGVYAETRRRDIY